MATTPTVSAATPEPATSNSLGISASSEPELSKQSALMSFTVKCPTTSDQDFKCQASPEWSVAELKNLLHLKHPTRAQPNDQRLIYAGRILENYVQLKSLGNGMLGSNGNTSSDINSQNFENVVLHLVVKKVGHATTVNEKNTPKKDDPIDQGSSSSVAREASTSIDTPSDISSAPALPVGRVVYIKGLPYLVAPKSGHSEAPQTFNASHSFGSVPINAQAHQAGGVPNNGVNIGPQIRPNHVRIQWNVHVFRLPSLDTILTSAYSLLRLALVVYLFWPRDTSLSTTNVVFFLALSTYFMFRMGFYAPIVNRINVFRNTDIITNTFNWFSNSGFIGSIFSFLLAFVGTLAPGIEEVLTRQFQQEVEEQQQPEPENLEPVEQPEDTQHLQDSQPEIVENEPKEAVIESKDLKQNEGASTATEREDLNVKQRLQQN